MYSHVDGFCSVFRLLALFKRVCRKYLNRYPEAVVDHINMWREIYDEEDVGTQNDMFWRR